MGDAGPCKGHHVIVSYGPQRQEICGPPISLNRDFRYDGPYAVKPSAFGVIDPTLYHIRTSEGYRLAKSIIHESIEELAGFATNVNASEQAEAKCTTQDLIGILRQTNRPAPDVPEASGGPTEIVMVFATEERILRAIHMPNIAVASAARFVCISVTFSLVGNADSSRDGLHACVFIADRENGHYFIVNPWGCVATEVATKVLAAFSHTEPMANFIATLVGPHAGLRPLISGCKIKEAESFQLDFDIDRAGPRSGLCLPASLYMAHLFLLVAFRPAGVHSVNLNVSDFFLVLHDIVDRWHPSQWSKTNRDRFQLFNESLYLKLDRDVAHKPAEFGSKASYGWRLLPAKFTGGSSYFQYGVLGFYQEVLKFLNQTKSPKIAGASKKRRRSELGGGGRRSRRSRRSFKRGLHHRGLSRQRS